MRTLQSPSSALRTKSGCGTAVRNGRQLSLREASVVKARALGVYVAQVKPIWDGRSTNHVFAGGSKTASRHSTPGATVLSRTACHSRHFKNVAPAACFGPYQLPRGEGFAVDGPLWRNRPLILIRSLSSTVSTLRCRQ